MTTTKRFFLTLLSFFLIVVSVCPSFAYAAEDEVYYMDCSQPIPDDNSGYAEVLFERSNGNRYVRVFYWQYLSATNGAGTEDLLTYVDINYNGVDFGITFSGNPSDVFYGNLTIYDPSIDDLVHFNIVQDGSEDGVITFNRNYDDEIISFNLYGNYSLVFSSFTNSYLPAFSVVYGDSGLDINLLNEAISILNQLHADNVITQSELTDILTSLNDLSAQLSSDMDLLNSNVYNIAKNIVYITQQLNDFSDRMHADLLDIYTALDYIMVCVETYLPLIDQSLLDILYENISANEKLDRIIEILEMQGESNLTSPDTSEMDGYIDAENSLLDNSNVNVSDVVQVEVNQNALTVIWDLVEKFLNSHGKVFGMVLTVLSLGLVAMVLGRKV